MFIDSHVSRWSRERYSKKRHGWHAGDCSLVVSTFVSVTPTDVFNETSGHLQLYFANTYSGHSVVEKGITLCFMQEIDMCSLSSSQIRKDWTFFMYKKALRLWSYTFSSIFGLHQLLLKKNASSWHHVTICSLITNEKYDLWFCYIEPHLDSLIFLSHIVNVYSKT